MSEPGRHVPSEGIRLWVETAGSGAPVVILHGFTGSSASMAGAAAGLCESWRTISVDLVGHGRSDAPRPEAFYTMSRCVAQLGDVLDALAIPRAHFVGYSMGGRTALSFCAANPERVASLVLVGASPGIEDPDARAARLRSDRDHADRIEREGVAAFVERWMALPLFASQKRLGEKALAAAREQRLSNRAWGLAGSLRGMGTGAQPPLHDRLPNIDTPVLLVAGDEDEKFREIAWEMVGALPDARLEVIPEAGHAAHLENPAGFFAAARPFLEAHDRRIPADPGRIPLRERPGTV